MKLSPHNVRLPFATKPLIINGFIVEEYLIPAEKKQSVLEILYPFIPLPSMDEERIGRYGTGHSD